ncbi:sucrase ferredoxin [Kribbella deserti]|uniref:Sucrase ferredoxin n=1 Tax=Kribbella deserti TaxID=1926257 RepID=A0ABV6QM73_9ACTN
MSGLNRPGLCSTWCRELEEPIAGTAVVATGWLVVEQPGPWGAKAPTQSHFDPVLGARIDNDAKKADVRFGLIRTPGRHADLPAEDLPAGSRQVFAACTVPGRTILLGGRIGAPEELLAIDLEALARGDAAAITAAVPSLAPVEGPIVLVCTNGKRDECCAILGRPIAQALAAAAPGRVWESNHLGGHRFAPTATILPEGSSHGQLTVESALEMYAAATRGETVIESLRGRGCWSKRGQTAEIAVRRAIGEARLDVLTVVDADPESVAVRHQDGRAWTVAVSTEPADPPRPESCGKEPFNMSILRAGRVELVAEKDL